MTLLKMYQSSISAIRRKNGCLGSSGDDGQEENLINHANSIRVPVHELVTPQAPYSR